MSDTTEVDGINNDYPQENNYVEVSSDIRDATTLFLLESVNNFHLDIGVTILSGGAWFTAKLISGYNYYQEVSKQLRSGEGNLNSTLADYYEKVGENFYGTKEGEQKEIPNSFLHLSNVKIISTNGKHTPLNGALMRLKITAVDGFILGNSSSDS